MKYELSEQDSEIAVLWGVDMPTLGLQKMRSHSRNLYLWGVDLSTLGLSNINCQSRNEI